MLALKEIAQKTGNGEYSYKHYDAAYYYYKYPKRFQEYFKFAFVRNPWGRIYSQYNFLRNVRKSPCAQRGFDEWLNFCSKAMDSGNQFLFGRNRHIFMRHLTNQLDWCIVDGRMSVDYIGRVENIKGDFEYVCEKLDIKTELPHINKSRQAKHYTQMYNNRTREIVRRWHEKDIEYFGYKYGE